MGSTIGCEDQTGSTTANYRRNPDSNATVLSWNFNVKQIKIVLFGEAQVANVEHIHHLSTLKPHISVNEEKFSERHYHINGMAFPAKPLRIVN